jgi:hypothetical protein
MNHLRICRPHSVYREDSGENVSFAQENDLLRAHGHEVIELTRRADQAGAATMACEALGLSLDPVEAIEQMLRQRPDVVDIEALFPRWGPRALAALSRSGVPICARIRNYRHWCIAGTAFYAGAPCTDCLGKPFGWPGALRGCYRGRRGQSAVAATSLWLTDWSAVDHFVAVSQYVKQSLVDAGVVPADRISVKPNTCADPGVGDGSGDFVLFIGNPFDSRPEKGWKMLMAAWRLVPDSRKHLIFPFCNKPHAEVLDAMKRAAFVVCPAIWHEPFGRVAMEALACGTPVLATRMGGLPEIVDDGVTGWLVEPHPEAMADGLERAFEEAPRLRQNARAAYERLYTPELNHDLLMQAYAQAVAAKKVECAAMEVVA